MISYLMTHQNHQSPNQVKQFLPEKQYDLSLNLLNEFERQISSDESRGLSLSFRSSVDSVFTLDQEEYLATSVDSINGDVQEEYSEIIRKKPIKRQREQKYSESYTNSPTPTKFSNLLKENQKIVDSFNKK